MLADALTLSSISFTPSLLRRYSAVIEFWEFPTFCDFGSMWNRL